MEEKLKIGVIGGGASGMAAAIMAARNGANVTILEKNDRVGKKILMTGNGKCNFSNTELSTHMYYSDDVDFLRRALERFGVTEVMRFFQSLGLMIKDKRGLLYPASEQASVVLDVLRFELARLGVKVITGFDVKKIEVFQEKDLPKTDHFFRVTSENGAAYMDFDRIVISCGGNAYPKTGSDGSGVRLAESLGHKITATFPALVQLKCREDYFKGISGVRCDAKISVMDGKKEIISEYGEVQFTDYGISGIPVFQVSRVAAELVSEKGKASVHIDFLPGFDRGDFREFSRTREVLYGTGTVEEFFTGMLNKKIMQLFIKLSGLKGNEEFDMADKDKISNVFELCRNFEVTVVGTKSFENAQVTAGGVMLSEITDCFESKLVEGVFLTGELLDVDGKCGGYNLHWAWCSGCIAGESASA